MSLSTSIFLVGPMGSGKTTVGRHLAKLLNRRFIDLDQEIEARCGADIPWIFDVEGEEGFRERESNLLRELVDRDNIVLATGGGVVLRPANRILLHEHGFVVYLAASDRELYERTRHDTRRPLLQTGDRKAIIARIRTEREPFYREVAHLVYQSGKQSAYTAAEELAKRIQRTQH